MPLIDTGEVELWVERDGAGRPCLVLHGGLGVDHTLYRRSLVPLLEGCAVVSYDHRGNGRSARPPLATLTMEQLADDAAALITRLGLERPVIVGHSYGGFVAQELALRHPDAVGALVLVATGPGQLGTDEDPDEGRGAPLPDEAAAVMSTVPTGDAALGDATVRLLPYYLHRRPVDDVVELMDGTVFDAAAMVRGFEVLGGWSAVDRLGGIAAPTLVVVGRHDVFTSPPQGRRIARRVPGASLVELDDSGHFPWLDEPDGFAAAVNGWLADTGR
ncbi:MAG TPA: alpha/beta fold hydrolase [Ilumatobacteraceae bacterium]|nr:alpha/beta fold hydrolase [Ilumatobacteraceae bacterium]